MNKKILNKEPVSKTRLKRLINEAGGAEPLETLLLRFYKKMLSDTLIGFFFVNHNIEFIVKMQKVFILRAAGLVSDYTGKSPARAHKTLPPILKGHFDRRLVLLRETLKEAGLSEESIQTWVDFENQFRNVIVHRE